ncbi:MAG: Amylo-alpha6-glucosidase [Planctomycetaceae bacterium]|nr:Amylo-alpha6-glucosidase [Planctomycetaceae bacterium]
MDEVSRHVSQYDLQTRLHQEWIEPDGLGGFASGTAAGIRTRRYHALLLTALNPPTNRIVLVNGFEATLETDSEFYALSSQYYGPDIIHPRGIDSLIDFTTRPWPKWTFELPNGLIVTQELFVPRGKSAVFLRWGLDRSIEAITDKLILSVRPLISGRDYHSLHRENERFQFERLVINSKTNAAKNRVDWQPYPDLPVIQAGHNGRYMQQADWYRNFLYLDERERGLDDAEDLASPGVFTWDLKHDDAYWLLTPQTPQGISMPAAVDHGLWALLTPRELLRRSQFANRTIQASDAYLARRDLGLTIIAGFPWFTDWGRDTFISIRGLCLATGRLIEARQILLGWSKCVSEGMLPNRFPDAGSEPEFNSVDASLWFVIAVYELLQAAESVNLISESDEEALLQAVEDILRGYRQGTRFGIHCDSDGLLAAGSPGLALTWMDARIQEVAVTPRIGKPVEIQALWINALRIGEILLGRTEVDWRLSQSRFLEKFWLEELGHLADVVDVDHQVGRVDSTFRPNQVLAIGGLPFPLLEDAKARRLLEQVERKLLTPVGLRTLAPDHPSYRGHCQGGVLERDFAYHQGTVWPWLMGPFVEGWVRVHGGTSAVKQSARARFLEPLSKSFDSLGEGLTHIPEIADGDCPHTSRGCPFQAWSLGEYLRLDLLVLTEYTPGN